MIIFGPNDNQYSINPLANHKFLHQRILWKANTEFLGILKIFHFLAFLIIIFAENLNTAQEGMNFLHTCVMEEFVTLVDDHLDGS